MFGWYVPTTYFALFQSFLLKSFSKKIVLDEELKSQQTDFAI